MEKYHVVYLFFMLDQVGGSNGEERTNKASVDTRTKSEIVQRNLEDPVSVRVLGRNMKRIGV